MQPILVSCETPFRKILQRKKKLVQWGSYWSSWGHTGPVRVMTLTGPVVVLCNLLLNGASHDTKIGCIRLVLAEAKKFKFSFLLCASPLNKLVYIVTLKMYDTFVYSILI